MPKYTCSECSKILIRNAAGVRVMGAKSFCESAGKHSVLTRLRIRKKK